MIDTPEIRYFNLGLDKVKELILKDIRNQLTKIKSHVDSDHLADVIFELNKPINSRLVGMGELLMQMEKIR